MGQMKTPFIRLMQSEVVSIVFASSASRISSYVQREAGDNRDCDLVRKLESATHDPDLTVRIAAVRFRGAISDR